MKKEVKEYSFAMELLRDQRNQNKRLFILNKRLFILLVIFFLIILGESCYLIYILNDIGVETTTTETTTTETIDIDDVDNIEHSTIHN